MYHEGLQGKDTECRDVDLSGTQLNPTNLKSIHETYSFHNVAQTT